VTPVSRLSRALLELAAAGGVVCFAIPLLVARESHALPRHEAPADSGIPLEKEAVSAKYAIEVMVLHATNAGRGIDKRVGDMPELKKPPFSSYDSYELLAKTKLPLSKGEPQTYRLPNGRLLKTDLKEDSRDETFKISASIDHPKGKAFLPLLEVRAGLGQAFIVAGQTYKSGILVLVLKVVKA
jgi:hypothetical protein